jgi:predicted SprT family Zn-dependent metalloprotease
MRVCPKRKALIQRCLERLAKEFNMPYPQWFIEDPWTRKPNIAGIFHIYPPFLSFNPKFIAENTDTLETVRHEFGHYLISEKMFDYPEFSRFAKKREQEKACCRFERNLFALGILPKNQRRLLEVV